MWLEQPELQIPSNVDDLDPRLPGEDGQFYCLPRGKVVGVLRDDVRLEVDRSRYFESDRVGIKATMRVGVAFPHPAAVVRLYDAP